ncbi:uncharacterized protein BDR25DRAFT_339631 [Lindgomyces ingoldianus]|uniref:Uncharacterized protein n=1 Tax=Lindgomyces ingoldianus TaxID=673940 RepID=A0ACB6REH2_9PLEO|nr:uncharacterized protein BDR25DRAFT_339631 [Lindgomyces ingoldianus]KAF2476722.1 hypothetical protein BDR25DRAFT_339631 [Lindgomyces ingoldianus]
MSSVLTSPFLSLPAEVRNQIYVLVFSSHVHLNSLSSQTWKSNGYPLNSVVNNLSLLLTCRQVYKEANLLAFSHTRFLTLHQESSNICRLLEGTCMSEEKLNCIKSLALVMRTPKSVREESLYYFTAATTAHAHWVMEQSVQIGLAPALAKLQDITIYFSRRFKAEAKVFEDLCLRSENQWEEKLEQLHPNLNIRVQRQIVSFFPFEPSRDDDRAFVEFLVSWDGATGEWSQRRVLKINVVVMQNLSEEVVAGLRDLDLKNWGKEREIQAQSSPHSNTAAISTLSPWDCLLS